MAQKQSKAKTRMAEVRARLKKPAKRAKATAAPKAYSVPGQPHGSAGPKKAIVQDLVSRPEGATLSELMLATGWQAHSMRGFLSGTLKKKMGLPIHSAKSSDGARTYRITSK
jgi:Protein of unknown function (DUF3489)